MKALLLAAGMGSRLRPLTDTTPKCMVPIMGRPLFDYWLELLGPAEDCSEILINTHHLPEPVRRYVAQSPYRSKITLAHEDALLGTGGTLIRQLPRLLGDEALVAHADNLTLFPLTDFRQAFAHRPEGCVATMMTFETDSPRTCGIVALDAQGVVQAFHAKVDNPPGHLANAAVFLFGRCQPKVEMSPAVRGVGKTIKWTPWLAAQGVAWSGQPRRSARWVGCRACRRRPDAGCPGRPARPGACVACFAGPRAPCRPLR